ncbi:hypothetical protein LTR84_001061 [Exophiala bonariae]|uniref:SMODS and SLOG-associating 2TM effector domain-containing protein n=1 Tax=Exophiala bonariae TaxID=1690606 RepID=A0AAV9NWE2_9EURO|nr:hypothetical protein LTR84_001061 [Exophiala bonariae]
MATSKSHTEARELSKKRKTESEPVDGEGDYAQPGQANLSHDDIVAGSATDGTPLLAVSNSSQSSHGGGSVHNGGRRDDDHRNQQALRSNKLDQFCERLDIVPPKESTKYAGFKPKKGGDWARILSSIRKHQVLSYALKALAVVLVILQLGLGITISVLTSLEGNHVKTVVIILGATNSFVGGLAAILQYWGQPTRESRYYASLKLVQSDVEALIGEFKDPNTNKYPYEEGKLVMAKYAQANKDAWSNDPMIWIQNTKPRGQDDRRSGI